MNKKNIALLVSVVALGSLGAHAQVAGQASAGGAGGQVSGQAGVGGGQVNGQINGGPVNGQINSAPVNGRVNPRAQANGQANAGGQVNAGAQAPNPPVNGQVNGGVQRNDAQVNGGAQGNIVTPGAPGTIIPGDDPRRFPRLDPNNRNQPGTNSNPFLSSGITNQSSGFTNLSSGVTNQFLPSSDGFGANTNRGGLTPTSRDPRIRRLYATNNAAANGVATSTDVAATPFDRGMVTRLRQRMQAQRIDAGTSSDVHFTTSGGQVTLTGSVPTQADKARIVAALQGTPGVVSVTDQLSVNGPGAAATGTVTTDQPAPSPAPAAPASNP